MKRTILAFAVAIFSFGSTPSVAVAAKPPSVEGMQVYANGVSIGRLAQSSIDSRGYAVLGVVTREGYYFELHANSGLLGPNPSPRLYFEGAGCTGQAYAWLEPFIAYQGVIFRVERESWELTPNVAWYVPRGSKWGLGTDYSYASYYYNKTCFDLVGTTGYPKAYPHDPKITGLQLTFNFLVTPSCKRRSP